MNHLSRLTALATLMLAALPLQAKDITVSAAASLKDAFQEIAAQYKHQHPDVDVKLNTAGSGVLLQQLLQGAPVDVVAFADQKTMDMAAEKNAVDTSTRRTFVRNDLVLIVPKNSRTSASSLQDLKRPAINRIALSNPESVPVGRYAKAALEKLACLLPSSRKSSLLKTFATPLTMSLEEKWMQALYIVLMRC